MIETTLCYPERDGKYLMLHRIKKKNDINRDKWIGIGGKFEKGEDAETCVKRETLEETGLTLTDFRYCGVIDFFSDDDEERMHLFHATAWQGDVIENCDEGDLAWIEKERLLLLPIWEGDKIFLRLMDEGKPFFHLSLTYQKDKLVSAVLDGKALI